MFIQQWHQILPHLLEKGQIKQYQIYRVVDFMGNTGYKGTHGLHFLGLKELFFNLFLFRYVAANAAHGPNGIVFMDRV